MFPTSSLRFPPGAQTSYLSRFLSRNLLFLLIDATLWPGSVNDFRPWPWQELVNSAERLPRLGVFDFWLLLNSMLLVGKKPKNKHFGEFAA